VTWLYGPLQVGTTDLEPESTEPGSSKLSKSSSFSNSKKPILKKRSMSEVMLQRSLSASSLVKQAAAAVQAQEKDWRNRLSRPGMGGRAATDFISSPFSSRRLSAGESKDPSEASSGIISPTAERKHIHFNEQVEQCIAVEIKGDDDDDADRYPYGDQDSDSDGGGLVMKRVRRKRIPQRKKLKGSTTPSEGKTIAMLPSTTLKYREDTPEPQETAMKHSTGVYRSPLISPSSSQETLRPSRKGKMFFVDDDDDDEDEETADSEDDSTAVRGWQSPKASSSEGPDRASGLQRSSSTNSLNAEPAGMRRTPSGMFMPYEEGEAATNDGLFGRVIDTVNTARDIAHVIWNVGWRK